MTGLRSRRYLKGSWFATWFVRGIRRTAMLTGRLSGQFVIGRWISEISGALRTSPLRAYGAVLIAATSTNAVAVWLMGKEVGAWGLWLRAILLLIGLVSLTIRSDWKTLQQGSVIMTWMFETAVQGAAHRAN